MLYKMLCDLCILMILGFTVVIAEDKRISTEIDTDLKGNCSCGGFPTKAPAEDSEPLLSQSPGLVVKCDDEGATTCKRLCIALATAAKAKGPEVLCKRLKDVDELKLSAFYKICEKPWSYADMTADECLCCAEGNVKQCSSAAANTTTSIADTITTL